MLLKPYARGRGAFRLLGAYVASVSAVGHIGGVLRHPPYGVHWADIYKNLIYFTSGGHYGTEKLR